MFQPSFRTGFHSCLFSLPHICFTFALYRLFWSQWPITGTHATKVIVRPSKTNRQFKLLTVPSSFVRRFSISVGFMPWSDERWDVSSCSDMMLVSAEDRVAGYLSSFDRQILVSLISQGGEGSDNNTFSET